MMTTLLSTGKLFQTRDAAAAKEQSPMIEQHVVGTTSKLVIADRRCRHDSTSAVRRRLLVRYDGAWSCRQRKVRTASLYLIRCGTRSQ